jgi:hypothetical protein
VSLEREYVMAKEVLHRVPESEVGATVQQFIDFDGKTDVVCRKDASGTWTIEAS